MELLLASASPRRRALLEAAGFDVEVVPSRVPERRDPAETPEAYVCRLAEAKAAATPRHGRRPVVAADTVVVVDGQVLEKPDDPADAARMLRQLAGRRHEVVTGVTVACAGEVRTRFERTAVDMAPLNEPEIAWYVASGEPLDKAGAYGIQGLASRFVERIEGSYTNVVGLPVALVYRLLGEVLSPLGVDRLRELTGRHNGDNLGSDI